MSKIKIMCTSTGCLDYAPERYKKYDIDIIRIIVNFKGREYHEGYDLDPVDFYRELEEMDDPKNNLPTTAMPYRETIAEHFNRAYEEGYREVIVISLSAYLGGTCNLISLVAKDFADKMRITVVDSKIACFGEGFLAITAATLAEEGKDHDRILREIDWMIKRQEFIGVDGKLDYLIYNGRLKGGKALMGKMLNICPVIHFTHEGEIVSLQSVRTEKKALARSCEIVKELIGDRSPDDYLLWHYYTGPSLLETLREIEPKYGVSTNHEDMIVSPVSGCHNGPWLAGYGIAFLRREDEPLDGE